MRQPLLSAALALVVLALGFALDASAAGAAVGEAIAYAIAVLSEPLLQALGTDVTRTGVELRATAGWAVRVSEVCDGTGLMVTLVAAAVALAPKPGAGRFILRALVLGVILLMLFNLARVLGLAVALDRWPAGFGLLHDRLFPWLTLVILGLVLIPLRLVLPLAFGAAVLGIVWAPLSGALTAVMVPVANLMLPGLPELGTIAGEPGHFSVGTFFLAGTDPVRLFRVPIEPAHFTLALPAILTAVIISRRWLWLVAALPLMLAALVIAAPVAVWGLAAAEAPVTLLLPDGQGAWIATDYALPETWRAIGRFAQNTLVHFLLLVMPFLAVSGARRDPR